MEKGKKWGKRLILEIHLYIEGTWNKIWKFEDKVLEYSVSLQGDKTFFFEIIPFQSCPPWNDAASIISIDLDYARITAILSWSPKDFDYVNKNLIKQVCR